MHTHARMNAHICFHIHARKPAVAPSHGVELLAWVEQQAFLRPHVGVPVLRLALPLMQMILETATCAYGHNAPPTPSQPPLKLPTQ